MSNFVVYEHWRADVSACFYVGKGRSRRAHDTKRGRNRHYRNVVAKLSREGFEVDVRIVAEGLSEEEAFALEVQRIAHWRALGAPLTNLTDGGEGASGFVWTEEMRANNPAKRSEVRAKISGENSHMKRPEVQAKHSAAMNRPEVRAAISAAISGGNHPMKRSEVRANHWMKRPEMRARFIGENNPMKRAEVRAKISGENHPMKRPEVRAKVSAAQKGRMFSEAHCAAISAARNRPEVLAKVSAAQKGRTLSEEHRAAISAAMQRPEVRTKFSGANSPTKRPEVRAKISAAKKAYWEKRRAATAGHLI
ncbi:MAG TPA: NUMOD3 domain-containing DNA-binding protein [Methylocystis sp.]